MYNWRSIKSTVFEFWFGFYDLEKVNDEWIEIVKDGTKMKFMGFSKSRENRENSGFAILSVAFVHY